MTVYDFRGLWGSSSVAPSFGIMRQTKTLHGPLLDESSLRERPFFYTPVYALFDAIEAVKALPEHTAEAVRPFVFNKEVDAALAALIGSGRDAPAEQSQFPGPESSFFHIVTAIRAQVRRLNAIMDAFDA